MPRPRISDRYVSRIETLTEEGKRPSEITRLLEDEAKKLGANDWPSESAVRRAVKEHLAKPPDEQRQAALFRWPQSMENSSLPWEAAAAALELLRFGGDNGYGRPTVRLARWYWRVSLAAPRLPPMLKAMATAFLTVRELVTQGEGNEQLDAEHYEWYFAYGGGASNDDRQKWADALRRRDPRLLSTPQLTTEQHRLAMLQWEYPPAEVIHAMIEGMRQMQEDPSLLEVVVPVKGDRDRNPKP